MKAETYQPLTKKQLNEVIDSYATAFPEWERLNVQVFARTYGPIVHYIGIEPLRYKAYRPWSSIRAAALPTVRMLHQVLDIKHRVVELRAHPNQWKAIVAAMEQQFQPSIRRPMDLQEIKTLCEQQSKESTNDLCMLAILNAYIGQKDDALIYCNRLQTLPSPSLAPRLDWEARHKEFAFQLRQAIETGNERQFLDAHLQRQE